MTHEAHTSYSGQASCFCRCFSVPNTSVWDAVRVRVRVEVRARARARARVTVRARFRVTIRARARVRASGTCDPMLLS